MNKEIGGYYELEDISENGYDYYPGFIKLNSARNCFLYIIKLRNIKKVYIPAFLCESIKNMCIKNKVSFEEYDIDDKLNPIFSKTLNKDEYLLLVNYYGHLTNEDIENYKNKLINIVVDNSQSFFQKPVDGIDTFYSCRKYFGVPDGGILYTPLEERLMISKDYSNNRTKHLIGRKTESASAHYSDYRDNEKLISTLGLMEMSDYTSNIMCHIDNEKCITTRNRNYDYLDRKLKKINFLSLNRQSGPFCYPLLVKNGKMIREILINNHIYIPILWPNMIGTTYTDLSYNMLPLPCDQRYGKDDIEKIWDIILEQF